MVETDPDGLEAYFQKQVDLRRQVLAKLNALCDELVNRGVDELRFVFDGYSDSGGVEQVVALFAGQVVPFDYPLEDLEDEVCSLLPSGWEINDGAFGELVLKVDSRQLVMQYHERIASTEYCEEVFKL